MFRRLSSDLPADPSYAAANLAGLGLTISSSDGRVQRLDDPSRGFEYFVSDLQRANDKHRSAVLDFVESEIEALLGQDLDVKKAYLSGENGREVSVTKPEHGTKYVDIYATDLDKLRDKDRVIVIVGETNTNLGILSTFGVLKDLGLVKGSIIHLLHCCVEAYGARSIEPPGFIILNPGQLLYSHKEHRNMSFEQWWCRDKENALAPDYVIDETHNRLNGHRRPEDHVSTVLESVVPGLVKEGVKVSIIGVVEGGLGSGKAGQDLEQRIC